MQFDILILFAVILCANAARQNFIINGDEAEDRSPSFALVMARNRGGGHIISNRHVLTAAHIIQGDNLWLLGIGSNDVLNIFWAVSMQGVIHSEYNPVNRSNDIGILVLMSPITFNENTQPIALPSQSLPLPNEQGKIYGFGKIEEDGVEFPTTLKTTFKRVTSSSDCTQNFPMNTELQFCASDSLRLSNICLGDLGSGFITLYRDNQVLVGIATQIVDECSSFHPALYTKVSAYMSWINGIIL